MTARSAKIHVQTPGFEQAVTELEQVVNQLESGQLPLDAALDAYQRGVTLLRQCRATLDAADRRILQLEGEALAPLASDDNL